MDLRDLYLTMSTVRRLEESLLDMFDKGELVGTTHTCIGQEANCAALAAHLDIPTDTVVSNHRCHGHYIALTGDVTGLAAEVMGRVDGVCSGRGGSQHLCRPGFFTNGIQGSIVPLATGLALAAKERGDGGIVTVFIGDGTLGQGAVYECLNIASLWSLPLLVVVEDNAYAQTTPRELAVAGSMIARAEAFDVESREITSTDVAQIYQVAGDAVASVRAGRPGALVIHTYRLSPHSKGDDTRDPREVEARWEHDPLTIAAKALPEEEAARLYAKADAQVSEAIAQARQSPVAGARGVVAA